MKRNFWLKKLPFLIVISALVITAAAWQGQHGKTKHTATDTIPDRNKRVRDIDDALDQLDKSRQEVERTLQEKDWDKEMKAALDNAHFDTEKMKQQIDEALKNIDAQKIQLRVQKAMKEADFEKMKTELQEKLDNVDLQQAKEEIAKAMKDIDAEKIKANVDASISKIDFEKIKAELDKVKEIDFKEMEENLKKVKPEIEKSMQTAKESIEKAKKELLEYKGFIDGLDKDGLINKNENYTIEYKSGDLIINGKKQSDDVVKKYNSFLNGRSDFTIKKDKDGFDINKD